MYVTGTRRAMLLGAVAELAVDVPKRAERPNSQQRAIDTREHQPAAGLARDSTFGQEELADAQGREDRSWHVGTALSSSLGRTPAATPSSSRARMREAVLIQQRPSAAQEREAKASMRHFGRVRGG